jgi:hypothetical protein
MKNPKKKLSLNKEMITKLNDDELNSIHGAEDNTYACSVRCTYYTCPQSAECGPPPPPLTQATCAPPNITDQCNIWSRYC